MHSDTNKAVNQKQLDSELERKTFSYVFHQLFPKYLLAHHTLQCVLCQKLIGEKLKSGFSESSGNSVYKVQKGCLLFFIGYSQRSPFVAQITYSNLL